jgi:hypothetical protein
VVIGLVPCQPKKRKKRGAHGNYDPIDAENNDPDENGQRYGMLDLDMPEGPPVAIHDPENEHFAGNRMLELTQV